MPVSRAVPPIPNTPMVDIKTGNITPEWRVWLVSFLALISEIKALV